MADPSVITYPAGTRVFARLTPAVRPGDVVALANGQRARVDTVKLADDLKDAKCAVIVIDPPSDAPDTPQPSSAAVDDIDDVTTVHPWESDNSGYELDVLREIEDVETMYREQQSRAELPGLSTAALSERVVDQAADVQDMGRRVVEVLGRDPRDLHYAGDKLSRALTAAAAGLAYVGWNVTVLTDLVTAAHHQASQDLH